MGVRDSIRDAFPGQSGIGLPLLIVTVCCNGCKVHSTTPPPSLPPCIVCSLAAPAKTATGTITLCSFTPSRTFLFCFVLISTLLSDIVFLPRLLMLTHISLWSWDALLLRSIKALVMASAKCIRAQRQQGGPDALLSALAVPDAKSDSSSPAIAALPLTKI